MKSITLILFVFTLTTALMCVGAQQIVFQENNVDPSIKNRDNRQPIYAPSKCPVNELFYPGDQKNDWICDCRPAHLFHPLSDMCHPAYRRGPCSEREYLLLPQNTVIPKCAPNPCIHDGWVPWKSNCAPLDSTALCPSEAGRPLHLSVNATTLQLECQRLIFNTRIGEEEEQGCPLGGRRSAGGKC